MFYLIKLTDINLWLYETGDGYSRWTDNISEALYWENDEDGRNVELARLTEIGTPGGSTNPSPDERPERP